MLKRFYSHPAGAIVLILVVAAMGIQQFLSLPIALYPNTSRPVLILRLQSHHLTADSFRDRYGTQLEGAVQSITEVEALESTYRDGSMRYRVTFDWGTELEKAKSDIRSAISPTINSLPEEFQGYTLRSEERDGGSVYISLRATNRSMEELYRLLDKGFRAKLEQLEGVDNAWLTKPSYKVASITLSPEKMAFFGINPDGIRSTIRAKRYDLNLGYLKLPDGGGNYKTNVSIKADTMEALADLVITRAGSRNILLKDVADIRVIDEVPSFSFRGNGEDSLVAGVSPKPTANIEAVANLVKDATKNIAADLQSKGIDFHYDVLTDPSTFIKEAIQNVIFAISFGMLTATIILFLFVGSYSKTLVVAISIPISLLAGIVTMSMMGIEINLISMGAMALAVGMVVDGSIVVFENILRRFEEYQGVNKSTTNEVVSIIYDAVLEVRSPVVVSIMTTVIVFAPLIFTLPLTSAILGDLAKVIVSILSLSILVTIFLIPPLSFLLIRARGERNRRGALYAPHRIFIKGFNRLKSTYLATLRLLLTRRPLRIGFLSSLTVVFGVSTYLLTNHVKRELMATPHSDKAVLVASLQDRGISDDDRLAMAKNHEDRIKQLLGERLKTFMTIINQRRLVYIITINDKKLIEGVTADLEDNFTATPAVHFYINAWNPTSLEIPNPPLLEVVVNEPIEEDKRAYLKRIKDIARGYSVGRIRTMPRATTDNNLVVEFNDEVISELRAKGAPLNTGDITSLIRFSLQQQQVQSLTLEDGEEMSVEMGLAKHSITSPSDIENLLIRVGESFIPLRHFLSVKATQTYSDNFAEDGQMTAKVKVYPKKSFKGDKAKLRQEIKEDLLNDDQINPQALSFLDTERQINANILSLTQALAMAILLIFLVIVIQFGRIADAFNIMLAIPVGFMGVGVSLFVFQSTLSINSMLGLILLCGTAVNNSIIFVDFFRSQPKSAQSLLLDRIMDTAALRFRPIMVTTITTIIGMLPVAFAYGSGGEILQPLGIAVSGGLGISTLFTLFVVPIMLYRNHKPTHLTPTATIGLLAIILGGGLYSHPSEASPSPTISIQELVAKGIENDKNLSALEAKHRATSLGESVQLGSFLPRVSLKGSNQLSELEPGGDKSSVSVEVSQRIPISTKDWGAYHEAKASSQLAFVRYEMAKKKRQEELFQKILDIAHLDSQINVLNLLMTNADALAKLLSKNYQRGLASQADSLRAEILKERTASQLNQQQQSRQTKWDHLKSTAALPEGSLFPKVAVHTPQDLLGSLQNLMKATPSEGLLSSSSASLSANIARSRIHNATGGFIPELGLKYSKVLDEDNSDDYVAATFTWNLFAGGQDYHSRKARELDLEYALDLHQDTKDSHQRDIAAKLKELEGLLADVKRNQKILELYETLAKASEASYKRGRLSAKAFMDDQNTSFQAQLTLLDLNKKVMDKALEISGSLDKPQMAKRFFVTNPQ